MYDLLYLSARLLRGGSNGGSSFYSNGVPTEAVNGKRQMVRHDSDTLTNKDIASYMTSGHNIIVARSTYYNTRRLAVMAAAIAMAPSRPMDLEERL